MEEYTSLQKRIFMVIAEKHPVTIKDVQMVFDCCKSIDETIYIIEKSRQLAISPMKVAEIAGF